MKDISKNLLEWYDINRQKYPWRKNVKPYSTWISEIMLQQTQAKTVVPYFNNWMAKMPDIESVAHQDLEYILKQWEGLGYYARARNFYLSCKIIQKKFSGVLPNKYDELISLPGIGPYVASAILSISYKVCVAAIDVNATRVFSRLLEKDFSINKHKCYLNSKIKDCIPTQRPGDFNQAIMDLGRFICKAGSPLCSMCPIQKCCLAHLNNTIPNFPQKTNSKTKPNYNIAVGIIQKNDKILITKRKERGLLGGLWEFPGGKIINGETSKECIVREIKEEIGIIVLPTKFVSQIKHQYSHFSIVIDAYFCNFISGQPTPIECDDIKWINKKEVSRFPFPKANHKLFKFL